MIKLVMFIIVYVSFVSIIFAQRIADEKHKTEKTGPGPSPNPPPKPKPGPKATDDEESGRKNNQENVSLDRYHIGKASDKPLDKKAVGKANRNYELRPAKNAKNKDN